MRRRDKTGGKEGKTQRRQTVRRRNTAKVARRRKPPAADAAERIALLTRERNEALEQQAATSEILGVIRRSPTNAQPVFDAIVESASRLCDAVFSVVWRYDGDLLHYVASHNFTPELLDYVFKMYPKRPDRSVAAGRAILDGRIAHLPDLRADRAYAHEVTLIGNWRASLAVPMLREGKPVGVISVGKAEAVPFSERQIQLLSTFADQAVIAIENVRLFEAEQKRTRELSEALEQQTATSEVLKVISSSPSDLRPVFQSMLENSVRICEAKFGQMFLCEGDNVRIVAHLGVPAALVEWDAQRDTFRPAAEGGLARAIRTKNIIHIADFMSEQPSIPVVKLGGARSYIAVPMLKENEIVGVIVIYRQEVRPFSEKQIDLVQNFAAQAVIAIENVQLLNDLNKLNQQLE